MMIIKNYQLTLKKFLGILMACYLGPRLRIIRRFGELPGLTRKVPKNPNPPGQHGQKKQLRSSFSNYKIRLFEKQKLRYNYGLTERQLLRYVKEARRRKGSTGFLLLQILEMRLDTIIFRLGLAPTIPSARQFVNHGHLLVNGKRVNIPSFLCEPGDQIQIQPRKSAIDFVKNNLLSPRFSFLPNHLEFDGTTLVATIKNLVDRKDLIFRVNELLIVEYYSRIG